MQEFYSPQAAAGGTFSYAKEALEDNNYYVQQKLDGIRYIFHKDLNDQVKIYSRLTSRVTGKPVIKTLQLQHLILDLVHLPAGSVLDGELIDPHATNSKSNNVVKVTGSTPERAKLLQEEYGFLEYRYFDILAYKGNEIHSQPLSFRNQTLYHFDPGSYSHPLKLERMISTEKELYYKHITSHGGEGVILKDINAPYHIGKRHKSWIKIKKDQTYDVVFMGIQMANEISQKKSGEVSATRISGQAGAIIYGLYNSKGILTPLGTVGGFNDDIREDITLNYQTYKDNRRVLEVIAQEQYSDTLALRHPRFMRWRDDKDHKDCVSP